MIAAGMIVVIGLLASICAVFPEEGIALGEETSLRFPTLTEMLEGDPIDTTLEAQLTPEELLALREQEMKHMQAEQQYTDYFTQNPARIHFPQNDPAYFDALYSALMQANRKGVRVVHYGDSQLEADRISCVLRQTLQDAFGGGGNGILPLQESLWSQTTNIYSAKVPTRYQVYGPQSNRREGSNYYGPMGSVSMLDSTFTLSISPKKQQGGPVPANYFNRITVVSRNRSGLRISAQGKSASSSASDAALQFTTLQLNDSTTSVSLSLSGRADIYGVMLDNTTGVSVDNIPMRGCSGTIFTMINGAQLREYYSRTNTQLIIMQFGGNSMPYIKTEKAVSTYVEQLRKQVRHMKTLAPDAKILFIGPSDMSTRINGKMQTYPMLRTMDESICAMVNEEGCAYWSLFESMGGPGSMARWANSSPALAGNDYVHFTRLGAQKAGQLLTDAVMTGYRYYIFRHPDLQSLADSLSGHAVLPAAAPIPMPQTGIAVDSVDPSEVVIEVADVADPREEQLEEAMNADYNGLQPGSQSAVAEAPAEANENETGSKPYENETTAE